MTLKVAINARLLADGSMRGWNRYAVNLVRGLADTGEAEILLLTDHPVAAEHRAVFEACEGRSRIREIASGPMFYPRWQERWQAETCRREGMHVLHTPYHYGLPMRSPCPTVATLHDAIDVLTPRPLKERLSLTGLLSAFYLRQTRKKADRIVTVSRSSAWDLVRKLRVLPDRIEIIPEAADESFHRPVDPAVVESTLAAYALAGRPYVFYVGGFEERKNLPLIFDALSRCKNAETLQVVFGGKTGPDADRVTAHARSLGLESRLHWLGRVPDVALPPLYAGALALVYPSLWEGFGLQAVEAMAVGCPVLAANATSLPEVVGEGGVLFDPNNPDELASLLDRLMLDPNWRAGLQGMSKIRGGEFSWDKTAQMTLELYRKLAAGSS
jgi:glycosyltransferase involved in cell wall biosynthesis